MAVLNLNDPVNGTTADATLIATNNAAIKTVVNGGLDNDNIASGAGIDLSKLDGYPADSTLFARGDGTWAEPVASAASPTPATTLPVSPANLQQAILVDSTSAPTYSWLFQYSSAASKWIFIGGSSATVAVDTAETHNFNSTWGDLSTVGPSFTVPRAGTYLVVANALAEPTASSDTLQMGVALGAATPSRIFKHTFAATSQFATICTRETMTGLSASQELRVRYNGGNETAQFSLRSLSVTPVTVT